jgi:hypothetical protein
MSLKVAEATTVTPFAGRWSIDTDSDRTGGHRLSGEVTMTVGGSVVELRLAGHAEALTSDNADARSISGFFRITNGAAAGLIEVGSFSGSFGPGTLVLRLTP